MWKPLFSESEAREPKRPDFNVCNLKGIECVHGNSIGSLICEAPTDSSTELFLSLADIDRFPIVIVEGINTVFVAANTLACFILCREELADLSLEGAKLKEQ
jgi:hypothetical protein